jgi:hypothetical protein
MQARVWNDNQYPHTERFKGQDITIPAGGFIPMDYDEAMEFRGQYTAILTDGEKNPLQEYKKIIRVEKLEDGVDAPLPLRCHVTGKLASSPEELKRMNAEHLDMLADPKVRDEVVEARTKELEAEVAALRAQLEAKDVKRGPGRPRKDA